MNEQFLELPEEKQLRIINAALEVFAKNSYKNAVTDEIAAKAGISKGLLFYYFHNKKSLYLYVYQYAGKIFVDYLQDAVFYEIKDFYELLLYAGERKQRIIEKTPYLMDFIVRGYYSQAEDISDTMNGVLQEEIAGGFQKYFKNIDFGRFREDVDPEQIYRMLVCLTDGYMHGKRSQGEEVPIDGLMEEFREWVRMFRQFSYKEEWIHGSN